MDGLLTFMGLSHFGTSVEGNALLQKLVITHGTIPALFLAKSVGLVATLMLMWMSHSRRWLRPLMTASIAIYITMALVPWLVLLSRGWWYLNF